MDERRAIFPARATGPGENGAFVFTNTFALTQPEVLVARAHEKFDPAGRLTHSATRDFLARFLLRFADWVATFAERSVPRSDEVPASGGRSRASS